VNVCPPAVTVPVRGVVVVFAAAVNVTVPLPEAAPTTVIQAAPLSANQGHPAVVVIANEPLPPEAGIDCDIGEMANEQDVAAACVIETVCPPIVMAAVRCVPVVFGAAVKLTVPLPVPPPEPLMVIQLAPLNELHVHPTPVVIVTDPLPPPEGTDCEAGLTEYVHGGAAACVTVKVLSPTVMVPVRCAVVPLAATENVTVPLPEPLAVPVTVIQLTLLVAVHAHPAVVTVNEPVAPSDGTDWDTGASAYVQGAAACVTVNV